MRPKNVARVVGAVGLLATAFVGMSSSVGATLNSATVLTEETNVGQIFTNNFNPADSESTSTQMSTNGLSYEPLIMYNSLTANAWSPWLAKSETFNSTGQSVTFVMNPAAKWSNGTPITAQDVANEFNALSNTASLDVFGVPTLARPAAVSGNTVTLTYPTPEYSNEQAIGSVLIFPVAGDAGIPASDLVTSGTQSIPYNHVIGSGPYIPSSYSGQLIRYTYNSHWAITPKPYVQGVNIPYYASNQAATEALVSHQLDWAGNDIPQITRTFVQSDPSHNHYYYPAGSTVTLWFNLSPSAPNGSDDCLADPSFRKAISMGIDRQQLSSIGETGYEQPASTTSGMTPLQAAYQGSFKNNLSAKGWSQSQVTSVLESNGFALDSHKYFAVSSPAAVAATGLKAKTECQFSIQDPVAYSDYTEDMQLISSELKNDHINVSAQGVSTGQWNANIATRNFDAIIRWGAGGSNPYAQFQNWLEDPNSTGGSTDYGDFVSAPAQSALIQLAGAKVGTPTFQNDVNTLANIMTNDVPVAPILYGADWDVYSTVRFNGWVTSKNQYAYPGPGGNTISMVVTHLTKS